VHDPGAIGAVNKPALASMLPQEVTQVAATFDVNCLLAPSLKVGDKGEIVKVGGGPTVSFALAVYAGPLVATTLMLQMLPWVADAVNKPDALMLPQEAVHVAGMFAVNCCVSPRAVVALAGVTTNGETIPAVVDALLPPLVAVPVIVQEPVASGAVYNPLLEIVPQLAIQVAALLAENCSVLPSETLGLMGVIVKDDVTGAVTTSYP
jgi:hypothetical protein